MGFIARSWAARSQRRGLALIVFAALAALSLALASAAQAHAPATAKAWGYSGRGQLGDGSTSGPESCSGEPAPCSTTPLDVTGLSGVVAMAASGTGPTRSSNDSLALLEGHTVSAWGENNSGSLGNGTTADSDV